MLILLVMASAATYRCSRFVVDDRLIEVQRAAVVRWVLGTKPNVVRAKIHQGITCFKCLSVWIAGAVTLVLMALRPLQLPALFWLATAGLCLVVRRIVDNE